MKHCGTQNIETERRVLYEKKSAMTFIGFHTEIHSEVILLNGPSSAGKSSIVRVLQAGKMLIVDHVITSPRIYNALLDAATASQMKTVLVSCAVTILRRREAERGDRCVGSAEASLQYLYPKTGYDLCVDSSKTDSAVLAEVIFSALSCNRTAEKGAQIPY